MQNTNQNINVPIYPLNIATVTASDVTEFDASVIWVSVGGDIAITPAGSAGDTSVTLTVASDTLLPVMATQVLATGTTATGIYRLF